MSLYVATVNDYNPLIRAYRSAIGMLRNESVVYRKLSAPSGAVLRAHHLVLVKATSWLRASKADKREQDTWSKPTVVSEHEYFNGS